MGAERGRGRLRGIMQLCVAAVLLAPMTIFTACGSFLFDRWKAGVFLSDSVLRKELVEGLPIPEYTDGHRKGKAFYATISSRDEFIGYAQSVYSHLSSLALYTGDLGECTGGIGFFSTYEFLPDLTPRDIAAENASEYTFLYTAERELTFPSDDEEGRVGEEREYARGTVQNVHILRVRYSETMIPSPDKKVEFEYNFSLQFYETFALFGGTAFDVDAAVWEEYVNGRTGRTI